MAMRQQATNGTRFRRLVGAALRRWSFVFIACTSLIGLPAEAGDLIGKVTASDGRPMPNVSIDLIGNVTEEGRTRTAVYSTRTKGIGEFAFRDLPDGVYTVCADKPHDSMLNPCQWETKRYEVRISAEQRTPNIEIPVKFGRPLRITVDDPGEALTMTEAKRTPDSLIGLSVLDANGNEHEMRLDFDGKKTKDYVLTVPVDEPLQVVVNSFQAELKLAQGEQAKTPLTKNHHRLNVQLSSEEKVERILRLELAKAAKE